MSWTAAWVKLQHGLDCSLSYNANLALLLPGSRLPLPSGYALLEITPPQIPTLQDPAPPSSTPGQTLHPIPEEEEATGQTGYAAAAAEAAAQPHESAALSVGCALLMQLAVEEGMTAIPCGSASAGMSFDVLGLSASGSQYHVHIIFCHESCVAFQPFPEQHQHVQKKVLTLKAEREDHAAEWPTASHCHSSVLEQCHAFQFVRCAFNLVLLVRITVPHHCYCALQPHSYTELLYTHRHHSFCMLAHMVKP